ncbi:hypothetical protein VKT23_016244 [Stygiomarasmius scandens]|uniref:Uncharacterized protein n=1 Tax=Marasmiellus scandens TaxID=2682957 RepID=A0ABR1IVS2_9AGAR
MMMRVCDKEQSLGALLNALAVRPCLPSTPPRRHIAKALVGLRNLSLFSWTNIPPPSLSALWPIDPQRLHAALFRSSMINATAASLACISHPGEAEHHILSIQSPPFFSTVFVANMNKFYGCRIWMYYPVYDPSSANGTVSPLYDVMGKLKRVRSINR